MSESKNWNSLLCRLCEAIIYKPQSIKVILKMVGQEVETGKPRSLMWKGKQGETASENPLSVHCFFPISYMCLAHKWTSVLEVVLHHGFNLCIQNKSCAERQSLMLSMCG